MPGGVTFDVGNAIFAYGRWIGVFGVVLTLGFVYRKSIPWRTFLFEIGLMAAAYFAYFLVRGYTEGSPDAAFHNGYEVLRFEQSLGMHWEKDIQAAFMDRGHWVTTLANWAYVWGHWPVIASTGAVLLVVRPRSYRLYRNAFLISGAIGLLIFATFPVAPPRFLDIGIVDTVTEYSEAYRVLQPGALTNQFAAVPSLHFGWNLVIGIAIFRATDHLLVRAAAVAVPIVMGFAIIVTGNHFIIDAVAGAAVALAGLYLATNGAGILAAIMGRPTAAPDHP